MAAKRRALGARARAFAKATTTLAAAVLLAGCAGLPTGTSNVTPISARLNASGCSNGCAAYMRVRAVGTTSWSDGPTINDPSGTAWSQDVSNLTSNAQYEYQACEQETGATQFTCYGPNGQSSSTDQFNTFALQGGAVWSENAQPGDNLWQGSIAPQSEIDGYASETSVAPGDTLHLHVNAPGARYRIEIERLGWYDEAGGRRQACIPSCTGDEAGITQPAPGTPDLSTGYLDAGWSVTDAIPVTTSWVTGYYEARLVLTSGPDSGAATPVWFVVRPPASAPASTIQVVVPVNTYQAYNPWPTTVGPSGSPNGGPTTGKSLYGFNSSNRVPANHVSFNRPLPNDWNTPFYVDYPLVRYLESQGYDTSYATDTDVDQNPQTLLGHHLVVVMGHSEYWSKAMRDAYEAARAAGVNLAFLGANDGYWQVRYADNDRTIVAYKELAQTEDPDATTDPSQLTTQFRLLSPPRPECQLEGVQYGNTPAGGSFPYTVVSGSLSDPWMTGTRFIAGDTLASLVGYEWDAIQPGCAVPPLTNYFHWNNPNGGGADAVGYTASSGARVFAAGGTQFAWGLNDDGDPNAGKLQLFMRHALDAMTGTQPNASGVAPRSQPVVKRAPPPFKPAPAPCEVCKP
jgi:N,N-dimethylformamidase beta subunit-like, C-terminal